MLAYLDDRELPDGSEQVYHRRMLPLRLLDSGRMVRAGGLCREPGMPAVLRAPVAGTCRGGDRRGARADGANRDYLLNTLRHLREMGVRDAGLDRIAALLPAMSDDGLSTNFTPR